MARTLLDRFGLGNERAVANAAAAALRRQQEDRLIAELVVAMRAHAVAVPTPLEPVHMGRAA